MLAAVVLIIYQHRVLSISTCDVLEWRTFIWDNLNDVVLYAPRHGAVTQDEGLIGLVIMQKVIVLGKLQKKHTELHLIQCCLHGLFENCMESCQANYLIMKLKIMFNCTFLSHSGQS